LERAVKGVTQKMLIQQLRELEKDALVRRTAYSAAPSLRRSQRSENGLNYASGEGKSDN
jgi:DNA-binding HxlR family transcriptional regulator